MSIKVTNWVWEHSRSRNGARLVMLAIADRANDMGRAWPSVEDLSERTLLSPRAVQKGVANLVEIGELSVESGGGRHRRNRYQVVAIPRTFDGVTGEEPGTFDGVSSKKPRTSDGVSREETPHFAPETPSFATETPNFATQNPVQSSPEPSVEPPIEPSGNQQQTRAPETLPATRTQAAAEAAEHYPDWLTELMDAISAVGIHVPWRFKGDDMLRVHNDIQRLGIPLMVRKALEATRSADTPPFSSRFFYDIWHRIRTPVGDNVVPITASRQQHEVEDWTDRAMARAHARMQQESS